MPSWEVDKRFLIDIIVLIMLRGCVSSSSKSASDGSFYGELSNDTSAQKAERLKGQCPFFFVFSFIVYALLHSRRRLTALKKGLVNALDNALLEAY